MKGIYPRYFKFLNDRKMYWVVVSKNKSYKVYSGTKTKCDWNEIQYEDFLASDFVEVEGAELALMV